LTGQLRKLEQAVLKGVKYLCLARGHVGLSALA
jgi:hypothetical protein